ncbi:MAG: ABC transporter substrate-binding protein [bacterium]|nr:ABC transporter substrate-binding protein [bacterium]
MNTTIRMGGVPEHFNFPWQLAQDYGFFTKENIDFKWSFYNAGTGAMVKALEAGELDMAILLTEGAVSAIIKGLQAKIVKQYITSPLIWGIHTGNHSGLENIGACEGKKYAISRFGSGSHLMAMIDAEVRNKKIEEQDFVLVENMPGAIQSLEANLSQVFFWEKYTTKPNVDSGLLNRIGEFITPWSCFQIVASNQILEQHPEKVEAILKTINFTCKQFMTADNSIDMILANFDMKPEDALAWFYSTEWNTDYNVSEKMLENVMYSLKKIGNIEKEVKPIDLVDKLVTLI